MEEFVERHAQDVAVNRGHAFHFPMLGASREGAVERFDLPNRALEQGARKCLDISVELLRSKKRFEDVFGSVSTQLPLIHHLEGEFAGFPARSHGRPKENRPTGALQRVVPTRRSLLSGELRGPLLEEGARSFFHVGRRAAETEERGLEQLALPG